jgi:hypothetical protein
VAGALEEGRAAFAAQAWADAVARLSAADRAGPLEPGDLERLATAAYLVGRDDDSAEAWARAHHELLGRGEPERAARCALWLAFQLVIRGETARGSGWTARARRVLAGRPDGAEHGVLLWLAALRDIMAGAGAAGGVPGRPGGGPARRGPEGGRPVTAATIRLSGRAGGPVAVPSGALDDLAARVIRP